MELDAELAVRERPDRLVDVDDAVELPVEVPARGASSASEAPCHDAEAPHGGRPRRPTVIVFAATLTSRSRDFVPAGGTKMKSMLS